MTDLKVLPPLLLFFNLKIELSHKYQSMLFTCNSSAVAFIGIFEDSDVILLLAFI